MKNFLLFSLIISAISVKAQYSWTTQNSNFPVGSTGVTAFSVVDVNNVWAFGFDGSGANANYQTFTKTSNAGATWTSGSINLGNPALAISDLTAVSGSTAWIVATPRAAGPSGGVWKTVNGGTSWAKQTTALFNLSTSYPDIIHFFDANNGVSIGDPDSSGKFEIYTTSNGGTNWNRIPSSSLPLAANEHSYANLSASIGDNIWFGTDLGRLFKSADKGLTWTAVSTPLTDFGAVSINGKFTIKDANTAWIVNQDGNIYNTTDGGNSWNTVSKAGTVFTSDFAYVPGTNNTLISVGATSPNIGSSISIDGGNNWNTIETNTQKTALGVYDSSNIYAGGYNNPTVPSSEGIYKLSALLASANSSLQDKSIQIYPNPVKNSVNILSKNEVSSVEIFNTNGRLIKSVGKMKQVNVSGLAPGMYFLKVKTVDGRVSVLKMIKE